MMCRVIIMINVAYVKREDLYIYSSGGKYLHDLQPQR